MLRKIFIALLVLALFTGTAFAQVTAGLPQTMDLKAGFNFVSFSVKPLIQAADFKNQNPIIQELYSFSAASGSFLSVSEGTLINLTAGRGYIVKASAAGIISVTGEPVQTVGILNLKMGFNLIGISKQVTAMKFSDLMKAYPVIRGLYRYSAASGSFIQVLKNSTGLAELLDGIDPTFTVGQAYFMYVDSDTAMNYDNGAITMTGGTPLANVPAVTGLMYDQTGNRLKWNPITASTTGAMYQYVVKIDGMTYPVAPGMMDFQVPATVMAGQHSAQIQAMMQGTATTMSQYGPWAPEPALMFTTTGGGTNNLAVTGLTYVATGNKLKWNPIIVAGTTAGTTAASSIAYNVKIDGQIVNTAAITMNEYLLPATMTGSHIAQVQAMIPGSDQLPGPWSPEPALNFTVGGGTGNLAVTGLMYDAAGNKLKWNPIIIAGATTASAVMYNVNIDGKMVNTAAVSMNEYILPAGMTGSHNAQVQAVMPAVGTTTAQMGPWSPEPALNFTIGGGTGNLGITGLIYDAAGNKLKWNPVMIAGTTAASAVMYNVKIDGQMVNTAALTMTEYILPATMTGAHIAQIQAAIPAVGTATAQMGPWSPEPPFNFMIGGGTNPLGITGLTYVATGNKLKWNPVVMAGTTTANAVMYNLKIDGQQVGNALAMSEYILPTTMTGSHVAQVQAVVPASTTMPTAQMGPWSPEPPFNFMIGGGTNPLNITGLMYDPTGNKLKWNPVVMAGTTTANAVMYNVKIDGQQVGNALTISEFILPAGMTGSHFTQVQALVPASATMPAAQMGPWSPEPPYTFTVGSATASALVFAPVPMAGTTTPLTAPLTVTITWPSAPADGAIFYTLDGSDPLMANNANVKTYAFAGISLTVNGNYIIKAAGKSPTSQTPVVNQTYVLGPPATGVPAITPPFNYQSATNKVTWMPVNYNGLAMKYRVKFDGIEQPTLLTVAEFMVPANTTTGPHTLHVRAEAPATAGGAAQVGPWSPIDPFIFNVGGTTANMLVFAPMPMAGTTLYAPLTVTITWPNAPAGGTIFYTLDGSDPNGATALPYAMAGIQLTVNGTYNIKAVGKSPTVQAQGMQTYVLGTSTSGTLPAVTGLMYDPTGSKLKWNPVATPATGGTVSYMVAIDTQTPVPVTTTEYMLPTTMTGAHKATVFARIMSTTGTPQDGMPAMLDFTVGGTTANALVFAPVPMAGTNLTAPLTVTITWPNAPAGGTIFYTLDGSDPNGANALTYAVAGIQLTVNGTYNIKAVGKSPTAQAQGMQTYVLGTSTTGTLPAVTGLMYDAAGSKIKWNAVAPPATGGTVSYMVAIDTQTPVPVATLEYMIPTTMTGAHKATVFARIMSTTGVPQDGMPAMLDFTVGGGTTTIPTVTGLMYDSAMNKLKWNAVTPPAASTVSYMVMIDNQAAVPVSVPEYMIPTTMTGAHNASVFARFISTTGAPQDGMPANLNFTVAGGTPANLSLTFNPMSGSYPNAPLTVTITPAPADAKVYFATEGAPVPTPDGTAPAGSKTISIPAGKQAYVIKAIAHLNGVNSIVYEQSYSTMGTGTTLPNLVFAPATSAITAPMNVTISAPNLTGITIKYTMDGVSDPMSTSALTYAFAGIPLNTPGTYTIKAVAVDGTNIPKSNVTVMTYNVTGGTTSTPPMSPTITPNMAGPFPVGQVVTILKNPADTTHPNAIIRYTMDGFTEPTPAVGMTYSSPIPLNTPGTFTIKAIAVDGQMFSSSVSQTITINSTTPPAGTLPNLVFAPATSTVTAGMFITITCPDATNVMIKYTLDGNEPTFTNGLTYAVAGIPATTGNMNIKAVAFDTATNLPKSNVTPKSYIIQ